MSKYIICIDKGDCDNITIGKKYEVFTGSDYYKTEYFIGDDGVEYLYFPTDRAFMLIEDWRKFQIEKLKI